MGLEKVIKNDKYGISGSSVLSTFLAVAVVVLMLGSVFTVLATVSAEGNDRVTRDGPTLKNYCYNYGGVDEYKGYYINNTGQEGVTVFWTTRSHDRTVYRGRPEPLADIYSYYGPTNNLTRLDVGSANAWPSPDDTFNSQFTFIYENATGFVGWTYTKNSGATTPKALDRTRMTTIPSPNAVFSGSDIVLTWSAPSMTLVTNQDDNTDITDINAQLKGYLVYRSTTNATWNDNASAGPVVGSPSDWTLVGGTVASPIVGTTWTDTTAVAWTTHYYSLKLVFNGSANVETMWGGFGSNGVTYAPPNNPPTLTSGAVTPASGTAGVTSFTYNVTYTDADNDPPASGYPKVNILKGGAPIADSPFAMSWQSGANNTGANYLYSTTLATAGSDYTYKFNATDGTDYATEIGPTAGPTVTTVEAPTVTTNAATGIGTTTATVNMTYTIGTYTSVEVRFDYKKTTDNAWSSTSWETKMSSGGHSESLTSLSSGTEYQFNATLKYDSTTIYGGVLTFNTTTITAPTVTTTAASSVSTTTATLNMNYTVGSYSSVQVRFDYKKTADTAWTSTSWATKTASGSYSESLTGLSHGTQYQFNATLKYDSSIIHGSVLTFTTTTTAPTVTTTAASSVGTTTATLNMDYTVGSYASVEVRFDYKKTADTAWTSTSWVTKTASGSYSEGLTGLSPNTEYQFNATLKYDTTVLFGTALQFTTAAPDTTAPAAPTGLTATSGNEVVDLSWSANTESDLAGYNVYRSTTSGSGYAKINTDLVTGTSYHDTGLTNGVTYYYVVTAEDSTTTPNESPYSNEVSAKPEKPAEGGKPGFIPSVGIVGTGIALLGAALIIYKKRRK